MKSHGRVEVKETQTHSLGRPDDPPVRYRVLGRYGDVLNAARGQRAWPDHSPPSASIVAISDSTREGTW